MTACIWENKANLSLDILISIALYYNTRGDSLIKVGTDVQQVQNLGWAKFKKTLKPGLKMPQNLTR